MDRRHERKGVLAAWLGAAVLTAGCGSAGSLPSGGSTNSQGNGSDGMSRTANGQIIRPALPSPSAAPSAVDPTPGAMESPGASAVGFNSDVDAGPAPEDTPEATRPAPTPSTDPANSPPPPSRGDDEEEEEEEEEEDDD